MARMNNVGPVQQPGIIGAGIIAAYIGEGVSTGTQPPTNGGVFGTALMNGAISGSSANGASTTGADDHTPSTKDGQGGGTGRNPSASCMSASEHNASLTPLGGPRNPITGAPAFCFICTLNGWIRQLVHR